MDDLAKYGYKPDLKYTNSKIKLLYSWLKHSKRSIEIWRFLVFFPLTFGDWNLANSLHFRIFGFYFLFLAKFRRFPPRLLVACFPPSFFREILRRISRESRTCWIRSRNSETTQIRKKKFHYRTTTLQLLAKPNFEEEESKNPKKEKKKKMKK